MIYVLFNEDLFYIVYLVAVDAIRVPVGVKEDNRRMLLRDYVFKILLCQARVSQIQNVNVFFLGIFNHFACIMI